MNEVYSYPFVVYHQNFETTINNSSNKNFFLYAKSSSSVLFNLDINDAEYSNLNDLNAFCIL